MKQLKMAFSGRELDELALAHVHWLRQRKVRPDDPRLLDSVDLAIRLTGATGGVSGLVEHLVFQIPWVTSVLRKALRDAGELPKAKARINTLAADLIEARKLTAKPKSRFPKRKALPMKPAAAAGGDPTGVVGPLVNDPLPAAAAEKAASS